MAETAAPDYAKLKAEVQRLARGPADPAAVEERLRRLSRDGIPRTGLTPQELLADRQGVLKRVQAQAEEYEQIDQSCAKSPVLAIMEAFGFGEIGTVKALSALPGVALTGETCGAVLGGIVALSAYFGSEDLLDFSANARCYARARKFVHLFAQELGTTKCREIHEQVVFGRHYAVADIKEGYPAFLKDKGYEKCGLPPGVGARIAAGIILDDMEKRFGGPG